MNKQVRADVFERAAGKCEAGSCDRTPEELDHFFGRAKADETVENCWAICREHHREKTDNFPSRAYWLARFGLHSKRCGHMGALERVLQSLEFVTARSSIGDNL
jgi:hypothetical protein